ncbi:MAG: ornithine cyclodeaminase family protein, partial [Deltaproteobacteria bacterium]|nr:ornithine cyclodeaminase family protein [Deltaproteobacteria bacterium]
LCLLGSQWMARTHAQAFLEARPIKVMQVYSPTKEHREAFAREVADKLGVEVRVMATAEEAVKGAHIVACCTDSHRKPVIQGDWLEEGMFVTNVLAAELDDKTLERIDYTVKNQPLRNLESAVNIAGQPPEGVTSPSEGRGWLKQVTQETPLLSEVITGKAPGRTNDKQITFFCNNEGTGIQFAAAGAVILSKLKEKGKGGIKEIPSEWFFQDIPD